MKTGFKPPRLLWVKIGKAQCEQMFSAVHPTTDIAKILRHVRFVPTGDMHHFTTRTGQCASCTIRSARLPINQVVER